MPWRRRRGPKATRRRRSYGSHGREARRVRNGSHPGRLTKDGRRSAQFEHTLVVTPTGAEILTNP